MGQMALKPQSQITFLYYHDLQPIAEFYEQVMGFELVQDQGMARIYRVHGTAYLGIVDGAKGHFKPQEHNAVLITLVVDDVPAWQDYLKGKGIKALSEITQDIHVQHFVFEDPAGYAIEVQSFLKPEVARMFQT